MMNKKYITTLFIASFYFSSLFASADRALHYAAMRGDVAEMVTLVAFGAKVKYRCCELFFNTPLHYAATYDKLVSVEWLLDNGAVANTFNEFNQTPLHFACYSGPSCVEALLKAGADVNVRDDLWVTPLHRAAERGWRESIEILIQWGVDIYAKNIDGHTAKDIAQKKGHVEIVTYLQEIEDAPEIKGALLANENEQ